MLSPVALMYVQHYEYNLDKIQCILFIKVRDFFLRFYNVMKTGTKQLQCIYVNMSIYSIVGCDIL